MSLNDDVVQRVMGELQALTNKIDQSSLKLDDTLRKLPATLAASVDPVRKAVADSKSAADQVIERFNEVGLAITSHLKEEVSEAASQFVESVATFETRSNRAPSLFYTSISIVAGAAAFGGGILFSSTAISANWIMGLLIGVVMGGAFSILAINRIEQKYGQDMSAEASKIQAYTKATRDNMKVEIERLETARKFAHTGYCELYNDFNEFKRVTTKQQEKR